MDKIIIVGNGEEAGRLWWDDNLKMHFEGNPSESARFFLEALDDEFQKYWGDKIRGLEDTIENLEEDVRGALGGRASW